MSATLPNLRLLADWLDASLYQTQFRPIALKECIKYENCIYDKNLQQLKTIDQDPRIENDPDLLSHLVLETIRQKLGVLVFCPTKARCETLAENIARSIYS
jgi:DNA polymerase theta